MDSLSVSAVTDKEETINNNFLFPISNRINEFLTTYDFNGISTPSTTHKACYQLRVNTINDQPPSYGPLLDNIKEFKTEDYLQLYYSDNKLAIASSSLGKQIHHFQFTINEDPATIKNLYVHWKGYTSNTHTNLYIWDYSNQLWELVGITRFMHSDGSISKTFVTGISKYINQTHRHIYLIAISRAATLLKQHLYTDYVQIKVGNPTTITLQDDAYHYNNETTYVEWWFFDVINQPQDIQFFISYHILNPKNGIATIAVGIFNGDSIFEIREYYPSSAFNASYTKPDINIGPCTITTPDKDTFLLHGHVCDDTNQFQWNLTFFRTAPPYDFIESSGESQYLCYLPGSWVFGTIKINDVTYSMNHSYGYHDHNWGGGIMLPCQWAWAVTCQPEEGFALAMEKVEHFTWATRALYITLGTSTYYFEDIETHFTSYKFELHRSYPFFTYYPQKRRIHAENNQGYVIDFIATVQKNLPVYMIIPRVLNEQVSLFQGTLYKDGQIIYEFEVQGFTDYSTI
jgi:hypothetical protein